MIDEELQEVLMELINIAFGSATAAIADLFDNFATLQVPAVAIIDIEQINELIMQDYGHQKVFLATQQFKGQLFQGEVAFVVDKESAQNMQAIVCTDEERDGEQWLSESMIKQSILEISNILVSCYIGKLAEMLGSEVSFAPPFIDYANKIVEDEKNSPYDKIIVITTVLEFQEVNVSSKLITMFTNEVFDWLGEALENCMENF